MTHFDNQPGIENITANGLNPVDVVLSTFQALIEAGFNTHTVLRQHSSIVERGGYHIATVKAWPDLIRVSFGADATPDDMERIVAIARQAA